MKLRQNYKLKMITLKATMTQNSMKTEMTRAVVTWALETTRKSIDVEVRTTMTDATTLASFAIKSTYHIQLYILT